MVWIVRGRKKQQMSLEVGEKLGVYPLIQRQSEADHRREERYSGRSFRQADENLAAAPLEWNMLSKTSLLQESVPSEGQGKTGAILKSSVKCQPDALAKKCLPRSQPSHRSRSSCKGYEVNWSQKSQNKVHAHHYLFRHISRNFCRLHISTSEPRYWCISYVDS
ncbi:hypothetical protein GYMLUDRAFT_502297 [Collybiopsis luxurians FD-317 M1]|uniref:Uncharacterized protein n=1 Tax=Collybiopsis luxurians FD-317 M1 TaxID=944289 RepID=A0A0D0CIN4_9AGAR|nr:hypothetical protein GYMLUDRAFT_502297 [Collybiopsis luxurians FD-317 M1]